MNSIACFEPPHSLLSSNQTFKSPSRPANGNAIILHFSSLCRTGRHRVRDNSIRTEHCATTSQKQPNASAGIGASRLGCPQRRAVASRRRPHCAMTTVNNNNDKTTKSSARQGNTTRTARRGFHASITITLYYQSEIFRDFSGFSLASRPGHKVSWW